MGAGSVSALAAAMSRRFAIGPREGAFVAVAPRSTRAGRAGQGTRRQRAGRAVEQRVGVVPVGLAGQVRGPSGTQSFAAHPGMGLERFAIAPAGPRVVSSGRAAACRGSALAGQVA
jgi:hypothetical protein